MRSDEGARPVHVIATSLTDEVNVLHDAVIHDYVVDTTKPINSW